MEKQSNKNKAGLAAKILFNHIITTACWHHDFNLQTGGGGGVGGGGVVLPIMAYRESPPTPERGTGVFRLHVCEREGISLVQVYERVRKSVISVQIDCNI